MKKLVIPIFLLISLACSGQIKNFTELHVANSYDWLKAKYYMGIPKYSSSPAIPSSFDAGGIYFNLTDTSLYTWSGTAWRKVGSGTLTATDTVSLSNRINQRWALTGNSSTDSATNFIGSTDAVPFSIRTNNQVRSTYSSTGNVGIGTSSPSALLDVNGEALINTHTVGKGGGLIGTNLAVGSSALITNTTGSNNTGIGYDAMKTTTTGTNNTSLGYRAMGSSNTNTGDYNIGVGVNSLSTNTTGSSNTSIGSLSLNTNSSGGSNIALGYYSGLNNTTQSNRLYINSLNRSNILGDTTKSIIYGYQDATASNQRLYLNSQLYLPYAASGVGTKALRINPSTGIVTYADTTAGGGGSQTWQQTLTSGSTLTGNNTIDGGGYNFKMNGTGFFSGRYDGTSTVTLANGGIAFGRSVDGKLTATGDGTAVIGYTQDNNAEISGTGSGSLTIGYANDGSKILNTANGSFVGGMAYHTGSLLKTSADGSFVWGGISSGSVAVDTISNTGYESVVFGHGKDAGVSNLINEGNRAFVFGGGYTNSFSNVFTYGVGSQQFLIDGATGNIGIGTSTPTVALDVVGAIKNTDSVSFTGLLPMSASTDSVVVKDTNGKLGTVAKSAFAGSASLTSSYIGVGNGSNLLSGNSDFIKGAYVVELNQSSGGQQVGFRAKNTSATSGNTNASLFVDNGTSSGQLFKAGTAYSTYKTIAAHDLGFYNNTVAGNISVLNDYGNINFAANGASSATATITNAGIGIGISTPSAYINTKAGTASANTAPLKLTTGTVNTTAEAGAMEYTTPQLFFTNGGLQRQEIFLGQQSRTTSQFDATSNTTLANITGLTANVVAGKTYRFEAILYTASGDVGGYKFAIAGTATATAFIVGGTSRQRNTPSNIVATSLGATVNSLTGTNGDTVPVVLVGTITVNAAGTLTVQFAQNTSNGTTSSVLIGSTLVVTEML